MFPSAGRGCCFISSYCCIRRLSICGEVSSYRIRISQLVGLCLPHESISHEADLRRNIGVLHIVGFIAILLVLAILAPKHDSQYVFVSTTNSSGWTNDGISWLVGLVSSVYPFLGYDAACHLSEEMHNPARNVPIAMVGSVLVNGILGLAYCILLLFSLGSLDDLLASPTGFPFIQLFVNVTGNNAGAIVMTLIISLTAIAANSAGLTSTSRTAWAFARDNALPFSSYFANIDERSRVPGRMVVLITVLEMLLGLIYLGSYTAFNAVLSMAIPVGRRYRPSGSPMTYLTLPRGSKTKTLPSKESET